jgi:hypothetical protein
VAEASYSVYREEQMLCFNFRGNSRCDERDLNAARCQRGCEIDGIALRPATGRVGVEYD